MPTVKGSGKLQQAILAHLDGVPRTAREVITEIVSGTPTESQYNGLHRAARPLIATGQLTGWLERSPACRVTIGDFLACPDSILDLRQVRMAPHRLTPA